MRLWRIFEKLPEECLKALADNNSRGCGTQGKHATTERGVRKRVHQDNGKSRKEEPKKEFMGRVDAEKKKPTAVNW